MEYSILFFRGESRSQEVMMLGSQLQLLALLKKKIANQKYLSVPDQGRKEEWCVHGGRNHKRIRVE